MRCWGRQVHYCSSLGGFSFAKQLVTRSEHDALPERQVHGAYLSGLDAATAVVQAAAADHVRATG